MTDEQKKEAKAHYEDTLRVSRRGFLQTVTATAGAGALGLGAAYFGYKKIEEPLRVGIIGTGDEGNVLIGALNPDYVDVKAICDIRPSNVWRAFNGDWPSSKMQPARPGLVNVYGKAKGWKTEEDAREEVKVYTNGYDELLADDDIEAVIIALPLWLHAPCAIDAMKSGKHVLTEKLMAHSVGECKEMARVAEAEGVLLSTGHQRHYSVLYANAVDTIKQGIIGDIHHIRAQWHRTADSWRPPLPESKDEFWYRDFDLKVRDFRKQIAEAKKANDKQKVAMLEIAMAGFIDEHGVVSKHKSVAGRVNSGKFSGKELEGWQNCLAQLDKLIEDSGVDAEAYGYQSHELSGGYTCTPLEELVRWRLWNRTGGGLMAELGSHQLDASGIFISAQFEGHQKVNPISVTGVGGRHLYDENRDIDDHVYCTFEYPGKGYFKDDDPTKEVVDPNKKVVVTYSSINGNGYGGYGEVVMGTDGTLILERESDTYLIGGNKPTEVNVDAAAAQDTYETGGGTSVAAAVPTGEVSRGYQEEIEHWAWCIRNNEPATTLHCHPKVAMADAIIALTSNLAMEKKERIEFNPDWFKIDRDEVPAGEKPRQAKDIKKSNFGAPRSNNATA
ncbi:Gfo/Idh/MocA family oxidoreductase [Aeoliella sp. ICT_H6.2]|uniref:Gfo/Idh/MocA family oxidoreductase n=1 Tax=Aeoliella straminimaris TaxID=2954799 RepID=A0A9X2JHZ3_9BACT|nr:Gfo/Idh/MocA family oxidoreductase [Aeoliella straminimaris]MCO6046331.1 Gfo/Idh/MocA family oxidoreductase [Aeoliella straminimaris]